MFPGEIGEIPGTGGGGLGPGAPPTGPSGATAPTVDAGGPYSGRAREKIQLDATVTAGSDPNPTIKWTVQSGGKGQFSDDSIEDPTFTPLGRGSYTLLLTVTPSDTGEVTDTATLTAELGYSGVRGKSSPYPRRVMIFGERYTVRSPYEERDLLERIKAQEEAKLERLAEKASPKVEKARYRLKRVKSRIDRVDQRDDYRAMRRRWDEELVTLLASNPWL